MKSKILILYFTFCLIFSASVRAEFKSGISLNQDQIDLKVIEYISDNNLSFHFSPSLNYNNISNSRIKVGSRYYFPENNIYFSESTFSLQYNTKNPKITTNLGYVKEITDIFSLSFSGGYNFAQDKDLTGPTLKIGLDFSWSGITDKLNSWQKSRKRQRLKENYDWEEEIITAILAGEIKPSMNKKQIEYSWGQPDHKYSSQDYQIWEYQLKKSTNNQYNLSHILYFEDEELKFWEKHQSN